MIDFVISRESKGLSVLEIKKSAKRIYHQTALFDNFVNNLLQQLFYADWSFRLWTQNYFTQVTLIDLLGSALVSWLCSHLPLKDPTEALHLASLLASHGYLFPIDEHILTVRNDNNSLYRFQTRYFWPSNCWSPENTDYAVYLCKRTMQNMVCLPLFSGNLFPMIQEYKLGTRTAVMHNWTHIEFLSRVSDIAW